MSDQVAGAVGRSVTLCVLFVLACVVQVRSLRYEKRSWQRIALQTVAAVIAAGMVAAAFGATM